jgi:hypothetical protein
MKKTILEWYEQLPEPIRSQAIENFNGMIGYVSDVADATISGFTWNDTPQGWHYWSDIHAKAQREFDAPIESDLVKAARKVVQYKDLEMDGDLYTAIHELEKLLK